MCQSLWKPSSESMWCELAIFHYKGLYYHNVNEFLDPFKAMWSISSGKK